jgi:hypothetical protein
MRIAPRPCPIRYTASRPDSISWYMSERLTLSRAAASATVSNSSFAVPFTTLMACFVCYDPLLAPCQSEMKVVSSATAVALLTSKENCIARGLRRALPGLVGK